MERIERRFLTLTEAGQVLGLSRPMLYRLISRGELTTAKAGRAVRVTAESVDEYVAACLARGNKPPSAA